MANKTVTVTVRGKSSFCKLLEDQLTLNFNKDGKEWTIDLEIDKDTAKEMKGYGIADRVKTKIDYLDGAPYMRFKQSEATRAGKLNDPPKIVDILNKPWDQTVRIGNGSVLDVQFSVVDYGPGKKSGVYLRNVRVLDLVPYEEKGFATIDENDPYYIKAQDAAKAVAEAKEREKAIFLDDFGLDDSIEDIGEEAL